MNLTRLTAYIGAEAQKSGSSIFDSLIKPVKNINSGNENYVVAMVFDLKEQSICFKLHGQYQEQTPAEYNYFGNNSAASLQYYLVRAVKDLHYLLTAVWNDLKIMLKKHNLQQGELTQLIDNMQKLGLVTLGTKKGSGGVNLQKLNINPQIAEVTKKGVKFADDADKNHSFEVLIRRFINDDNRKNKYVLVVPVVKTEDGEEIVLSRHPDYLELVKLDKKLGGSGAEKKTSSPGRVCYLCGQQKSDVSSDYTKKLSRSGINKIFTTKTINTAPYLQNSNYDYVYSVCAQCYQKLLAGEKEIDRQFRAQIAGESVFILPEGLFSEFDYRYLTKLKSCVDLAFSSIDTEKWWQDIEAAAEFDDVNLYAVSFVFYRTDGNSVTVLETIEDVPTVRIVKIMKALSEQHAGLKQYLKQPMTLGQIYRIIPVRTDKKNVQLDIGRVLSFYKAVLSGEYIKKDVLFNYAAEALDKGLCQISKQRVDNYQNLGLNYYASGGYDDFFIKDIIMRYLVLMRTCQQLGLLKENIFHYRRKGEEQVNQINTSSPKVNASINAMEQFLVNQGFNDKAKALFYLGILINRVAIAQLRKEHKTKPILKKIQFQGMKEKEVLQLYADVVEKLRQYDVLGLYAEAVMNRFHYYYRSLDDDKPLGERANVFYIMAGYAYSVGNKAPDISAEEENAVADIVPNDAEAAE